MQFSKVFLFATLALAAPAPGTLVSDIVERDNAIYIRQGAAPTLSALLGAINTQLTGAVTNTLTSVQAATGDLTSTVSGTATAALGTVTSGLASINNTITALGQGLAGNLTGAVVTSLITTILTGNQEIKYIIGNASQLVSTLNLISGNLTLNLTGVASGATTTINNEISLIRAAIKPFTDALGPLITGLQGAVSASFQIINPLAVTTAITNFARAITSFFQ